MQNKLQDLFLDQFYIFMDADQAAVFCDKKYYKKRMDVKIKIGSHFFKPISFHKSIYIRLLINNKSIILTKN
jgi:hypothetical protein